MSCPSSKIGAGGADQKSSERRLVVIQLDANGEITLVVFDQVETSIFIDTSPLEMIVDTETETSNDSTPTKASI